MRASLGLFAVIMVFLWGCPGMLPPEDGKPDAGPASDAGGLSDGGQTSDGGGRSDGGEISDAGNRFDGGAPDAGGFEDAGPIEPHRCNAAVGFVDPLPPCTPQSRCTRVPAGTRAITESVPLVNCMTNVDTRPLYDDGAPYVWTDSLGVLHEACIGRVAGASETSLRPLVLFFHREGGNADDVYDATSLRAKAKSFVLSGEASRPGFFIASSQGRNLHWPTDELRDGTHFDIYHRVLESPSTNPDIFFVDRLVDLLVSGGTVDPARIYVIGWGNGGDFAQLYAMARHETPTAGGNRVAAVAVYSSGDPFEQALAGETPSCQLNPYPRSTVPLLHVGRTCDLMTCDVSQDGALRSQGRNNPPGEVVSSWLADLAAKVGDPNGTRLLLDDSGQAVSTCTNSCSTAGASLNHARWPDGMADGSGRDHEAELLGFLRDHPLGAVGAP